MNKKSDYPLSTYLIFPGIAMLLGWGLRGHIGGGPFGAMIPGAMVALAISMLLGFRPKFTSVVVVFSVVGVGLGGEMTYGQTLTFLRDPATVWWGNVATAIKGGVWGLGGGAILGLGLIHHRVPRKTILIALVLFLIGFLIGFKLINEPKLIYFSDPINKPRTESWAGLLFGALALISYLKFNIEKKDFNIVLRFAKWGLISGALGFGLGGLWFVLSTNLPGVIFTSWWKMMEFTFGMLFGMGLGYAAWLSRDEITQKKASKREGFKLPVANQMLLIFLISALVYFIYPMLLESVASQLESSESALASITLSVLMLLGNYAFYGLILILVVLRCKAMAWQIGITLTFCHCIVDLMRDLHPQPDTEIHMGVQLLVITAATLIVAWLVAVYQRDKNINNSMFQILVWSTIAIAMASMLGDYFIEGKVMESGMVKILVKAFFVDIVFVVSAIYVSSKSLSIVRQKA